ncbi:hypothetical protein QR680_000593 [Steinernema hermaphroditum]|uniref:Protein kinase domain-containing protein n=1 Tax=Steinernema hermaphroditum TaxID=289476 RepID=A0AA39GV61_9BILA|nr:hypothetical protein QR680_000593 [Steinernema hermaphroditum]
MLTMTHPTHPYSLASSRVLLFHEQSKRLHFEPSTLSPSNYATPHAAPTYPDHLDPRDGDSIQHKKDPYIGSDQWHSILANEKPYFYDSDEKELTASDKKKLKEMYNHPPLPLPPPPLKLNQEEENARSLALALGIGIPCLIVVISGLVVGYFLYKRWRRKQRAGSIYASNMPIVTNQNIYSKPLSGMLSGSSENTDLWALSRKDLEISYEKKLGSGAFCNVFYGRIIGTAPICTVNPNLISASRFKDCEVAIKMLPSFADDIARSDFQQEINFMKSLNYHPHLVSMLGYVCDPKNPLLVVEYCSKGDLLHFIREKKPEIMTAYENGSGLRIRDLLSFSWQISNGLEYLSSVGCIHRDIALRNVLLDESNTCKIGDFGLCRLTDNLLYTARGGRLPLRWMAPESLRSFEYSFQSDVWSYGILLYELFTFGEVPYGAVDNAEILQYLESGQRLEKPIFCPTEIYSIMMDCWKENGSDRPSFSQICNGFVQIIESAQPDYGYVQATAGEP